MIKYYDTKIYFTFFYWAWHHYRNYILNLFLAVKNLLSSRSCRCKTFCERNGWCLGFCALPSSKPCAGFYNYVISHWSFLLALQSQVGSYLGNLRIYLLQSPLYFRSCFRQNSAIHGAVLQNDDEFYRVKIFYERKKKRTRKTGSFGILDCSGPGLYSFLFRFFISLSGIYISRFWRKIRKPFVHKNYSPNFYRIYSLCLYSLATSARIALVNFFLAKSSRFIPEPSL